jgi:hypothetical protein
MQPAEKWQEFLIEKVVDAIDEKGKINLPLYVWISDRSDLTKTDQDL